MLQKSEVVKPKTAKGRRIVEHKEPKVHENQKQVLLIKGNKTSPTVVDVLKDVHTMKASSSTLLKERNDVHPFDDGSSIEKLCRKFDHSLFILANANKKRPNNLVVGRTFDHQIVDMIELGVNNFKSISSFKNQKVLPDSKPVLVFQGAAFNSSDLMARVQNLFVDLFRGPEVTNLNAAGVEHCIQFTAVSEQVVQMRSYRIILAPSSEPKIPAVSLTEIGPSIDFQVRRSQIASAEHFAAICSRRQVKGEDDNKRMKRRKADIQVDELGMKVARVYNQSQDLSKFQTRKIKALQAST